MAPNLLPEAGGVADVLDGQVLLLKPALAVQCTKRLLAGGDQVLVVSLPWTYDGGSKRRNLPHHMTIGRSVHTHYYTHT